MPISEATTSHWKPRQAAKAAATPCPPGMRESDWVLPLDKVQPYLYWIRENFDAGLDHDEIATVATIAHQLYPGESTEYSCTVVSEGRRIKLKLNLELQSYGLLIIGLCTEPNLSGQLDWTIERFYDEMAP